MAQCMAHLGWSASVPPCECEGFCLRPDCEGKPGRPCGYPRARKGNPMRLPICHYCLVVHLGTQRSLLVRFSYKKTRSETSIIKTYSFLMHKIGILMKKYVVLPTFRLDWIKIRMFRDQNAFQKKTTNNDCWGPITANEEIRLTRSGLHIYVVYAIYLACH